MSGTLRYYRTYHDGKSRTHIEGIGNSYALCGLDVAGDDVVHEKPPEELPLGKHRVTCEQCRMVIAIVKAYIK